jgi:hypothetical protein
MLLCPASVTPRSSTRPHSRPPRSSEGLNQWYVGERWRGWARALVGQSRKRIGRVRGHLKGTEATRTHWPSACRFKGGKTRPPRSLGTVLCGVNLVEQRQRGDVVSSELGNKGDTYQVICNDARALSSSGFYPRKSERALDPCVSSDAGPHSHLPNTTRAFNVLRKPFSTSDSWGPCRAFCPDARSSSKAIGPPHKADATKIRL